ncbi:purple acid phosphatase family protein [Desertivirga brevis]|uniref:purple acid phosphatase family protein n=1 Tax=Desertivirga brevis TaxID=2810310 RepID=UPI001A9578C2|nr:metallophosphoesterase family protein [Pedobacter sp. SYSU D00873]
MNADKISRKNFLGQVAKTGALALLPSVVSASAHGNESKEKLRAGFKFLTQPYLQQLTADSVVIRWITNEVAASWIEYGEAELTQKAITTAEFGLLAANTRIHELKISGLKPNTRYNYRICSKEIVDFQPYKMTWGESISSETFSFTTLNPTANEVYWLVFNDIHDRPASFKHLFALNNQDPFDFVFLNGDMFDYQTDERQMIDHLLSPLTSLFAAEKPFLYARGNHETRGKYAREFPDYFTNPGRQYYFSFTQGPVHFIVLDTGEDKADDHAEYSQLVAFDEYREQQAEWLKEELKSDAFKKAPFRVVMMHIPVYHSGEGHGTLHCRKLFNPLFSKSRIDLMVCGHTHQYGVHQADPSTHNYPIVIGGGPKEGKRTLISVRADRKTLALRMVRDDGTEVGNLLLKSRK